MEIVEIEEVGFIIIVRVHTIMNFAGGEPTSIERRWEVCSILYFDCLVSISINKFLHLGLVTRFQYSCSLLDSSEHPKGLVLNLYVLEKLSAFSLNYVNLSPCTFCSKGYVI